ncbi:MAG: Crp/Fnr family transcriptional regulator [Bacteroidales bacterium]
MKIVDPSFVDSLHDAIVLKKGEHFIEKNEACARIGRLTTGIVRGYVFDKEGREVTTHFYQEGDMLIGSFVPEVKAEMSLQALEDCSIQVAGYAEVMSYVNRNPEITEIIAVAFQKLNARLQSRLESLINLDSTEKYCLFLKEYPNLINRVNHYHIANFLGITPTQLSRARKRFIDKCKEESGGE